MLQHDSAHLLSKAEWEAEIGMIVVQGQTRQKSFEDPIAMEKSWACWCTPVITVRAGSVKSEDRCPGWPGKKQDLIFKITSAKKS
jgi:hypothetical protein